MPAPLERYRDLDLSLTPHPITGNTKTLTEAEAVKRSIRNLLLTNNYERFFRPDIGANLTAILFNLALTPFTPFQLESAAENAIKTYEPRAEIIRCKANLNLDMNGFDLTIIFSMKQLIQPVEMTVFLKRTR